MTLLGQFALWAALLLGLWCIAFAFSGRWQQRPELAQSVIRSVYAVCGCLIAASIALRIKSSEHLAFLDPLGAA